MAINRKSLSQLLIEKGIITPQILEEVNKAVKDTGQPFEQLVVDLGYATEDQVMELRAAELGVAFMDISKFTVPDNVLPIVPFDLQKKYNCIPIRVDGNTLTLGMTNPKDLFALDDLRMRTKMQLRTVLVSEAALAEKLKDSPVAAAPAAGGMKPEGMGDAGGGGMGLAGLLKEMETPDAPQKRGLFGFGSKAQAAGPKAGGEDAALSGGQESDVSAMKELTEEAPIIKIANLIIQQAIGQGASDIHIEPQRRNVRVRYRVDGVLHVVMQIPNYVVGALISRFKIMSDMNIAERRIPQDGRIFIKMNKKEYDMRVSAIPTLYGHEKIVMRILDKSSIMLGMDKLGLYPETQTKLMDMAHQPNGLLLSTGPTGAGKTTTQYSLLNLINTPEVNIITIEDPVEYQLAGLAQVHVNRKAGLTFSSALRSFLRQDPDIIMVGEIRDLETAEIAIQAAMTGHLVLSTLHTNDAPSSSTRLIDMGVEPFLVSATLMGSMAQRLGRRVCSQCKEPYNPSREQLARFGFDPDEHPDQVFYHGKGCEICRFTGFKGRCGFYELMSMNDELADLIVRRAPLSELREAARANGMKMLREDGFSKVLDGVTTIEEVMRVVFTVGH